MISEPYERWYIPKEVVQNLPPNVDRGLVENLAAKRNCGEDGAVRIYDVRTGEQVAILTKSHLESLSLDAWECVLHQLEYKGIPNALETLGLALDEHCGSRT